MGMVSSKMTTPPSIGHIRVSHTGYGLPQRRKAGDQNQQRGALKLFWEHAVTQHPVMLPMHKIQSHQEKESLAALVWKNRSVIKVANQLEARGRNREWGKWSSRKYKTNSAGGQRKKKDINQTTWAEGKTGKWADDFLFVLHGSSRLCLICNLQYILQI